MERYRYVYLDRDGVSSESTLDLPDGSEGSDGLDQIENMGRLLTIEHVPNAPEYTGATPDTAVNEGDARPLSLADYPHKLPYKGKDGTEESEKAEQGPDPFPEENTPEGEADPNLPEAHEPETMPTPGLSDSEMGGPDINKPGSADRSDGPDA